MYISPTVDDHGKKVTCTAAQFDGNHEVLYDPVKAKEVSLNVTFKPQPMVNQTVKVHEGESAEVSFVFKANPVPTEIKWVVVPPPKHHDNKKPSKKSASAVGGGMTKPQLRNRGTLILCQFRSFVRLT